MAFLTRKEIKWERIIYLYTAEQNKTYIYTHTYTHVHLRYRHIDDRCTIICNYIDKSVWSLPFYSFFYYFTHSLISYFETITTTCEAFYFGWGSNHGHIMNMKFTHKELLYKLILSCSKTLRVLCVLQKYYGLGFFSKILGFQIQIYHLLNMWF